MIPPRYVGTPSRGERQVFRLLQEDPGSSEWVVMHSFGISKHDSKREAEIDLVVIVPDLGVLCLEVKGAKVSRHEGIWNYGYDTSREGPFRQASTAMHALRKTVAKKEPACRNILFWSGVVFTEQRFTEESPEWHTWQHIDQFQLGQSSISRLITAILEKAHKHAASRKGSIYTYDRVESRPSHKQTARLTNLLRGDFEAVASPRAAILQAEQAINHLTKEQYGVLDSLEDNGQILVNGLAGTGKSLLALEAARRAAHKGSRVLLVCYNRLLGKWIAQQVEDIYDDIPEQITARHLHGLMVDIAGSGRDSIKGNKYWRKQLPEQALLRVLDASGYPAYDYLVVDEAQDLLTEEYLDFLDVMLEGGLQNGKWVMFGDFANQAIYLENPGRSVADVTHALLSRAPHPARHKLTLNCRNAQAVSDALTLVCKVNPGYRETISALVDGKVNPSFWRDASGQKKLLKNLLSELRQSFDPMEIVVLSTRKDKESCSGKLHRDGFSGLVPLRDSRLSGDEIPYASIHAFKGLEAAAVVVTDISNLGEEQRALLYVAMSRARIRLELLIDENCRSAYKQLLLKNLRT